MISVFVLNATSGLAQFSDGAGTKADPYKISTWSELHSVREKLSSSFILVNTLDRSTEGTSSLPVRLPMEVKADSQL
jgi:hypothetical protein